MSITEIVCKKATKQQQTNKKKNVYYRKTRRLVKTVQEYIIFKSFNQQVYMKFIPCIQYCFEKPLYPTTYLSSSETKSHKRTEIIQEQGQPKTPCRNIH